MDKVEMETYKRVRKELWRERMIAKHGSWEAVVEKMKHTRSLVKNPGLTNSSKETIMRVNKEMLKGQGRFKK